MASRLAPGGANKADGGDLAPPSPPDRMAARNAPRRHAPVRNSPRPVSHLRSTCLFAQVPWKELAFLRRPQTKGLRYSVLRLMLLRTGGHFAREACAKSFSDSPPPRIQRGRTRSTVQLLACRMAWRAVASPRQPDYESTFRHCHSRLKTSLHADDPRTKIGFGFI